jgi:hypothetical protein
LTDLIDSRAIAVVQPPIVQFGNPTLLVDKAQSADLGKNVLARLEAYIENTG